MTELEKIQRAKMYMDKLANGINPVDDSLVPDEEVVNNVRLSRCFFFVSDVLRQVIENGGVRPTAAEKKPKKRPLEIPLEKREEFAYSTSPIPASEIAKRINALVEDENTVKLSYSGITTWLAQIGMLEPVTTPEGKKTKYPTEIGKENGITLEERTGARGTYQVVVYDTAAQHFVVDNLDAILAAKAIKNEQAQMQGTPWTAQQDEYLTDLYLRATPAAEIAAILKRSPSAIHSRLKNSGWIEIVC